MEDRRRLWRARLSGLSAGQQLWLAVAVVALPAFAYLVFVYHYGVNVPYQDEWAMVILYRRLVEGHLTLIALWTQHNENRILFPNLVMLGLDYLSHFDTRVEMGVSAVLLVASVVALAAVYRRTASVSQLWFIPAGFLLFSWIQYAVGLQGFAIALYMVVLAAALSLLALRGAEDHSWLLWLAIAAASVGSYSSIQGLAIWEAGLIFLLARGTAGRRLWIWIGSGCAITAIYTVGFIWGITGGGPRWVLDHPYAAGHYLAVLVGNTIAPLPQFGTGLEFQAAVGVIVLAVSVIAFSAWGLRPSSGPSLAVPLALITFGLAVDVLTTVGRAHFGLVTAASSRYTVFNLWYAAGAWLAAVTLFRRGAAPAGATLLVALGVVCVAQVIIAYHFGLQQGRALYTQREFAITLVRNYRTAPKSEVIPFVYQLFTGFRSMAHFLATHHLSVFRQG